MTSTTYPTRRMLYCMVILLACLPPLAIAAPDFDIPLIIENNTPHQRQAWPARGGIPLPHGLLQPAQISSLAVIDQQGRPVPAQFDPFVLWWGRDQSVKWLLVDLLADIPANGRADYQLVMRDADSDTNLKVVESEDRIKVTTGPLQAVISKTRGTILEEVFVDQDRDGRFAPEERIIRSDKLNGSIVRSDDQEVVFGQSNEYNMWGTGGGRIGRETYSPAGRLQAHDYISGAHPPDRVIIESAGPVRVTVRLEGRHMPREAGPEIRSEGLYDYTVRLHFYAGKAHIDLEHSLDNIRPDFPMHIYRINEARIQFAIEESADTAFVFGTQDGDGHTVAQPGATVSLLQDSANGEHWDIYDRLAGKSEEEAKETPGYFFRARTLLGPAVFRGYKIVQGRSWPSSSPELASGDQAPGWAGVQGNGRGISIFMHRFWMECPKALRLSNNRIEAVFLPEFSAEDFHVHSSARKSHGLTLAFHDDARQAKQDVDRSQAYLHPLVLRTNATSYARSKAYPRHLGTEPIKNVINRHWYPHSRWDRDITTANWRTLGMLTGFNSGGMHGNYWSRFQRFLRGGGLVHWEGGHVHAKWASESIPWLIRDYSFSPEDPLPQHRVVGWGPKELYTHRKATEVKGWSIAPYTSNIPAFSSPAKIHIDGEHLIHMWPLEWYYLSGSPTAKLGLMAIGNQAKYSTQRHFFKNITQQAPSLNEMHYFDDEKFPERIPNYFYTRIYSSHLLSMAWTYAATGDDPSLFYARWLARRILYLQRENAGTLTGKGGWNNIAPWQESETAVAAYALYRETGDKALLDIMGSWLEWAWHEAFEPGKGMPHRFKRGTKGSKFEHHWYPGGAAALCYAALGDPRALEITRQWAQASLPHIKKGQFLNHSAGQSAAYVLTHLVPEKHGLTPPEPVTDLKAQWQEGRGIVLSWTAPRANSGDANASAAEYWIKYADRTIVDHPAFPEELGQTRGFYHADNILDEPEPAKAGSRESFVVRHLEPHGAYGAEVGQTILDLAPGDYFFVLKSWDADGNMSPLSNVAAINISRNHLNAARQFQQ